MRPDAAVSFVHDLVTTWWTPLFALLFLAVVAYAFWPRNRDAFDRASRMPLRED